MIAILSHTNEPAFNLATEEYLLRHTTEDVIFLYINKPSIIVGKHQNALAEINFDFINKNNIAVHRRLSGGGTVYHDLQNLNFCFIKSGEKSKLVDFAHYSKPIIEALNDLGMHAKFGKRHDIQIHNKKISGNASHVYKNRVMHHGTLLFNSDLDILNKALKTKPLQFKDKAVKSVRSEVVNISEYLSSYNIESFTQYIFNYLLKYNNINHSSSIDKKAISQINQLIADKYSTEQWNYGYSPNYEFKKRIKLSNGIRLNNIIQVSKGKISECRIKSSKNDQQELWQIVSKSMIGSIHSKTSIRAKFKTNKDLKLFNITLEEWNQLFFS